MKKVNRLMKKSWQRQRKKDRQKEIERKKERKKEKTHKKYITKNSNKKVSVWRRGTVVKIGKKCAIFKTWL